MSTLICGRTFPVTIEQLAAVETPKPSETWFPISHLEIIKEVLEQARNSGYSLRRSQFGLSKDHNQMFGVIDLFDTDNPSYRWSIGIRNSHDKSIAAGIVAGQRVIVCDNLLFSGELKAVRKHTKNHHFCQEVIRDVFIQIPKQWELMSKRLDNLQHEIISDDDAVLKIVQAAESKIIASNEIVPILREFRKPSFPEFNEIKNTSYNLLMSFTEKAKQYPVQKAESYYPKLARFFSV